MVPLTIPTVLERMLLDDRAVAIRCARFEVTKLGRSLDEGKPAVLALVRARHLADSTENHQVLATGYEFDDESKLLRIDLYEPNQPGTVPTLDLNLARPSNGIQITQSTGELLRGLFVVQHSFHASPVA